MHTAPPFPGSRAIIAMVHALALPGTPRWGGSLKAVLERAREEALVYRDAGVDALIVENMHDTPYLNRQVGPEITAAMTEVGRVVKEASGLPVGIQILAGANREALAAALAADLDFIRAEGFVFSHVADEGLMNACAGELLRYRRAIGADHIRIFADIKKKHSSHAITSDVGIAETAKAAAFFAVDGVIVTGSSTGAEADPAEVEAVKGAVKVPVLVGSGVTEANLERFFFGADALIVGSSFKVDGQWDQAVDPAKVRSFMRKAKALR